MTEQIDADLKRRVLDVLIAAERADTSIEATDIDEEHDASEVITDDSVGFDDEAQSSEELGTAAPLEEAAAHAEADLQTLESLALTPIDTVQPVALIGFGSDWFVAGVVAAPFKCDGVTYEGLSADSPLYDEIEGLRFGDTFRFPGAEHLLGFVI